MKTIKDLKELIKQLSVEQRVAKMNRKTVNIKVERTIEPWEAQMQVYSNKSKLRSLFIVYGILRGKSYEQIEPTAKTAPDWKLIDKLKTEYGTEEVVHSNQE